MVQDCRLDSSLAFAGKAEQRAAFAGVPLVGHAAQSGCLVSTNPQRNCSEDIVVSWGLWGLANGGKKRLGVRDSPAA